MVSALVARLDDLGMPAWIELMVVSFILFWPAGLAVLFYLVWSGRFHHWKQERKGHWMNCRHARHGEDRSKDLFRRWMGKVPTSGNRAFDEYREETLRRLEDEQRDFQGFLERLRHAKDKAEFDQFMADRRSAAEPPPAA